MADETATLRDATVTTEPKAEETKTVETKTEPVLDLTADTSKDAAELGKVLIESGFTREQLPDLLQAPNALQSIQFMVRNNPAEFLNMLERTDPQAAKAFHEKMADIYVERYADKNPPKGKDAPTADPSLMQEIAALREKVNQSETREQQRENAAALARLESSYRGRVDELFNKVKETVTLTKSEERALRANLDADLAVDAVAKKRISTGNFVDLPTKLNTIIRDWTTDKKDAAEGDKTRRENASKRGFNEFQNGPGPVEIPKDLDYLDDTAFEKAFASALEQSSR